MRFSERLLNCLAGLSLPTEFTAQESRKLRLAQQGRVIETIRLIQETGGGGDFTPLLESYEENNQPGGEESELAIARSGLELFLGKEWRKVTQAWLDRRK